jgi:hypothetical protein
MQKMFTVIREYDKIFLIFKGLKIRMNRTLAYDLANALEGCASTYLDDWTEEVFDKEEKIN